MTCTTYLHRAPHFKLAKLFVALIEQLLGHVPINTSAFGKQALSFSSIRTNSFRKGILDYGNPTTSIDHMARDL